MNTTNKILPKLRFPEFEDEEEWEATKLKLIAKRITSKNTDNNITRVLTNSAAEGVVDQSEYFDREIANKNNLDGYYIIDKGDYVYNPRVSTIAPVGPISKNKIGKGVMSPLYTVFRFKNSDNSFFEQFFKTNHWHHYLREVSNSGARFDRMNITAGDFFEMPILLPKNPKEQQKIASCLSSLDDLITAESQKLEVLKNHKKGLMQQLFPAEGKTVPKLRFPEFENSGEWYKTTFKDITYKVSKKNKKGIEYPVYSINNKEGFIPQSEQFDDIDSNKRGYDISMYKIIGKNTFAYNPARINVGSIGYSGKLKDIIISSLYVCFKTNIEIDDMFLFCFMKTPTFIQAVNDNVEGGIRNYLFYENLSKISVSYPSIEEQQKIADFLSSIDELITAQDKKIEDLKQHKKGLMQQLFPQMSEL